MNNIFELPELLTLDGVDFIDVLPEAGSNGTGCDKGCHSGCSNGCRIGNNDTKGLPGTA